MFFLNYSRVPLSRTCAISNFALSRTKVSVPWAFTVSLGKICLFISNSAISNFSLSRTNFWSLGINYSLYLELFIKSSSQKPVTFNIRTYYNIRNIIFRIFEHFLECFVFTWVCVLLYFSSMWLYVVSYFTAFKNKKSNLVISNFPIFDPAISKSRYLENRAISNFLLGPLRVRDSGTLLYIYSV